MTGASYLDPRLTAVYDPLNPGSTGRYFYIALAGDESKTALDMGCGTGRLACALAAWGHHATGTEPAIACHRPSGEAVTWVLLGSSASPSLAVLVATTT